MSIHASDIATSSLWPEREWADDALAWIQSHVGPAGPLKLRKTKPWSVVASARTADGVVWIKEVSPALAAEPVLTAKLAEHVPGSIAEVVTTAGARLLMRDAGRPMERVLRRCDDPYAVWEKAVANLADLQIAITPIAQELPAFDLRPERLLQRFGRIAQPLIETLGDTVPHSLIHLDLSKKNVCLRKRRVVVLDWAASGYGHPFFAMHKVLNTLVGKHGASAGGREVLRVRDAYLEPWTLHAPGHELRRIFDAAYPLGALCRRLRWYRMRELVPRHGEGTYAAKADAWLESFWASLREPARLGI